MRVVSDLVLGTVRASAASITGHYQRLFQHSHSVEREAATTRALSQGYIFDLDDEVTAPPDWGFNHSAVTRTFFDELKPLLRPDTDSSKTHGVTNWTRGVDSYIWGQDYDRRIRSLFPTGRAANRISADDPNVRPTAVTERSRVSALTQQAIRRSRTGLQVQGSSVEASEEHPRCSLFLPSPFYVAYQVLTDPDTPGTEVSAAAALQIEIRQRLSGHFKALTVDYDSVTRALQTIENRASTSKIILERSAMVQFLCHYLAMRGMLNMELVWEEGKAIGPTRGLLRRWEASSQIEGDHALRGYGFRLHPSVAQLPEPGELLNELEGLPLPIEGGRSVFQGGLRFSTGGDLVTAISGPFGAGKTSACLSLAASLAPLGFKTLHLTCEEEPDDIYTRLQEAAPAAIRSASPLFSCVDLEDLQDPRRYKSWFNANTLRLRSDSRHESDQVVEELREIFEAALISAPIFQSYPDDRSQNVQSGFPPFARPIIVVDGLHQLFGEAGSTGPYFERALRMLIDRCRALNAVFIFTIAEYSPQAILLDYLCDLVLRLDREGFDTSNSSPKRVFKVLKARRQPARMGSHLFYLSSPKGFRIKANVGARAEDSKDTRWAEPDNDMRLYLSPRDDLSIRRNSQILLYGRGSSGKAGLGLSILHRRPLNRDSGVVGIRPTAELFRLGLDPASSAATASVSSALRKYDGSKLPVPEQAPYYEARNLVVSFLYPESYYKDIAKDLGTSRISPGGRTYVKSDSPIYYRASQLPDRYTVDVISLYPGRLQVEELLSKIENALDAAESRGLPHTGVLVDGIHNVFVQFPVLEQSELFWAQLYNMLRRRNVTVVTTHTQIELPQSNGSGRQYDSFNDFEHARRQAAPLLSVLISSADYVFDLSSVDTGSGQHIRLEMKSGLEEVRSGFMEWDRGSYRLGGLQPYL